MFTMALWGLIVAESLAIGFLLVFAGLAVVVPVLAHSTWHLYRKVVEPAARGRRLAARRTLNGGARDNVRAPHTPIPETPTRSKSTDRPSGKNAMPNCAQNETAHKTINARQLGE
jgi:hypothetical protein